MLGGRHVARSSRRRDVELAGLIVSRRRSPLRDELYTHLHSCQELRAANLPVEAPEAVSAAEPATSVHKTVAANRETQPLATV